MVYFNILFYFIASDVVTVQSESMDDAGPILETPQRSFHLSENPKMGFLPGYNVNNEQRDQYQSDGRSVKTGQNTNTLTMLQGEKKSGITEVYYLDLK